MGHSDGLAGKDRLKSLSFGTFLALDRVGVHLLPKHYYTPVADRSWLRRRRSLWQRPVPMDTLTHWNLDEQLRWLDGICAPYRAEIHGESGLGIGPGYGAIEAQILYSFVRAAAPARVVEVGGGTSTSIICRAAERNAGEGRTAAHVTAVEPSPAPELERLPRTELVRSACQELEPAFFSDRLSAGDLLFIDSSHAVKTGSEVPFLYLRVFPSLPPGVIVHVHDVFLPYLYRPTVLHEYFDWQETTLLAALLAGNDRLDVLCCSSALHHERQSRLREILPDYRPAAMDGGLIAGAEFTTGHYPTSFWMQTAHG